MTPTSTTPNSTSWEGRLLGGAHWSGVLRRGTTLQLTDIGGGANVAALLYNYEDTSERYNMPDTLKAQHTAFLTAGCVCYSDMGRVLCSITRDTAGWHDTIGGVSNAGDVAQKYGATRFQEQRNEYLRNGYDSLLNEVAKYGMARRDLGATVNFFSKVTVHDDGSLHFHSQHSKPGASVELRFEMNTLLVLSACPHPLDPAPTYQRGEIQMTAWNSGVVPEDDPCRKRCAENGRGFQNTEIYFD